MYSAKQTDKHTPTQTYTTQWCADGQLKIFTLLPSSGENIQETLSTYTQKGAGLCQCSI